MKKGLFVVLAMALMASSNAFAHGGRKDGGGDPFSLNGTYLFEASGYANLGSSGTPVQGEVGVLGTLIFAGTSITENLTMTAADGGQYSCNLTATGTYTPATSTTPSAMNLPMGSGSANFDLVIPNPSGKWADVLESDSTAPLGVTCGTSPTATVNSMVLKGHLRLIGWND